MHSTTFTRSQTFRRLFATLHVRWLSHIFNRSACIYQNATRWDLPPCRITIWLIDDVMLIFACLLVDLILGFVTAISTWETSGLELASTIILVLQANRLTKCVSHPKCYSAEFEGESNKSFSIFNNQKIQFFLNLLFFLPQNTIKHRGKIRNSSRNLVLSALPMLDVFILA